MEAAGERERVPEISRSLLEDEEKRKDEEFVSVIRTRLYQMAHTYISEKRKDEECSGRGPARGSRSFQLTSELDRSHTQMINKTHAGLRTWAHVSIRLGL